MPRNISPIQSINLAKLLNGLPNGAWVAVSKTHDKVLAYGFDLCQVNKQAQDSGESEPLVLRVPAFAVPLIL